jgi:hypothetical protein
MGISAVALTAGAFCGDQRGAAAEKAVDNNVAPVDYLSLRPLITQTPMGYG